MKLIEDRGDDNFVETLVLANRKWIFESRIVQHSDPRFEGKLISDDHASVDFTVIRLSTRRWFITGKGVPAVVLENAETIGKALVRHCQ